MFSARDIRNLKNSLKKKTFGGGYDTAEVDIQLATLAEQWDSLQEEKRMADERAAELDAKLKHYEKVELALQEALETARDTARRTEEAADRKARLIVEEAELRAQRIIQEAEQERYGLRQDLSTLTNRQTEVAARLRSFLMSELEILAQFQGEDPVGFIKLVAPERTTEERTLAAHVEPAELPPPSSLEPGDALSTPAAEIDVSDLTSTPEPAPEASGDDQDEPASDATEGRDTAAGETAEAPVTAPAETFATAFAPDPTTEPDAEPDAESAAEGVGETGAPEATPYGASPYEAPPASDPLAASGGFADSFGEAAEEPAAPEEPPTQRRSIPRSPWPDVETPTVPPALWGIRDDAPADAGGSEPPEAEPADAPQAGVETPGAPPAAPDWTSPATAFSASPAPPDGSGWSLRSLVTGDEEEGDDANPAGSEAERDKIRRILDDLD